MNLVLIGNGVALAGAVLMMLSGLIKEKKKILSVQCLQFTLQAISNLILGGVTGFISGIASMIRNVFCIRFDFTLPFKLGFIAFQTVMTLFFNTGGILGLIPPVSTCIFTWFLDTKSEIVLKRVIIITMLMWVVYDWSIRNYVSFAFDIGTIISNFVGIYSIKKSADNA